MTNTQQTTDDPTYQVRRFAHVLIRTIAHHGGKEKVFVQADGTLRVVARSVAEASVMIHRAEHYGQVKLSEIADVYQVRFWGTDLVGTYPTVATPTRPGVDVRTGMIIDQSSPELVSPWRYTCGHCGQQPLHHTSTCPNRRH